MIYFSNNVRQNDPFLKFETLNLESYHYRDLLHQKKAEMYFLGKLKTGKRC